MAFPGPNTDSHFPFRLSNLACAAESSLFVYSYKMILKTCGTTTLLMALEPLLRMTGELGMKVEWVAYTRKDFQRPGQQKFPHRDHVEEVRPAPSLYAMPCMHAYVCMCAWRAW